MRILDRYLLREFLGFLMLGIVTFLGIFVIVDVFEKVDTFVDAEASAGLVARFYLSYIPFVLVQVLPVAMLLASLMSLGRFARQHELTAVLMAGQSLWRAYASVLLFGLFMTLAAFFISEEVVPDANYRRRIIMQHEIRKRPLPSHQRERDVKYIGRGGRIYSIKTYDAERAIMRDIIVEEIADNLLRRRIDAQFGQWKEDHWELRNVTIRTFGGDSLAEQSRDIMRLEVPEQPADFAKEEREAEEIGWRELRDLVTRRRLSGNSVTKHMVDLQMKFAFPLTNLITVLVGAALSTRIRRGGMAIGFGLSLFISFVYFCALRAGQALGHGGALPPWVAAWIANVIFGGMGLVLFLRAQRGR